MLSLLPRGLVFGGILFLFGAGCASVAPLTSLLDNSIPHSTSTTSSAVPAFEWKSVELGIDRAAISFSNLTASDVVLYRISTAEYVFGLRASSSSASISEWKKRLPEASMLINGVYFLPDYSPSGWLKADNERIGTRSFDEDKSALLLLNPRPKIVTAPKDVSEGEAYARDAAQSYPLLVRGKTPLIKEESGKVARRTFVGTDPSGKFVYLGIVPYASISLYELSHFLATLPIEWGSILNLDGGPSTGLLFQNSGNSELIDSYVTVPNVLMVTKRIKK